MKQFTTDELNEALRAINSIIHKCEKAQEKFPEGNSQHTLLKNRLNAMAISKALITEELSKLPTETPVFCCEDCKPEVLISNLEHLHTTELGAKRIQKNLRLNTEDVVPWCKEKIKSANASITRRGKNWYITVDSCEITVNAYSYTIITAHNLKS